MFVCFRELRFVVNIVCFVKQNSKCFEYQTDHGLLFTEENVTYLIPNKDTQTLSSQYNK